MAFCEPLLPPTMNNYQYYAPNKPWLVLYCDNACCHIIDRFTWKYDAQVCCDDGKSSSATAPIT
ncbi:hypothetical protein MiSe_55130 [Microseira wollei NIES-4236]|uniref:Uncharacterized protein n=1 Tax=Microseira wollei NIES-4236 TaxID=2530354 RepID=A0AAV3XJW1_9CYAN|nr:hypothetical protein MiSe_55130 [Microseira wollei NIES-4236]